MRRFYWSILGIITCAAGISPAYAQVSDCSELRSMRQEDFNSQDVDPLFVNDCMMRGSSPPEAAKKRGGLRQGPAAATYYTGVTPPQRPPGKARTNSGGGSGFFDQLLQMLPFSFPPSLPDLFGGGGGSAPGVPNTASGVGVASGVGTTIGGGGGSGTPAEDSFRCEIAGVTADIPSVTGQYSMPCGGALELSDAAFTLDTSVEYVGHVQANKSVLKLYKRENVTEKVNTVTQIVGSKYVFHKEVKFPGYFCKGASVYAENVPLLPAEQFFSIGKNTKYLAIHLQSDPNPSSNYDPDDPSNASVNLNYDHTKEFIIMQRNGAGTFAPIGKDCDPKANILFGMPANMGVIAAMPSAEDYCSVQSLPMAGSCEPDVMWLNLDDSNFLYQPNASIQLHNIEGVNSVVAESDAYTAFYMRESSSLFVPWGTGLQTHADGTNIIYSPDFYIYVSPPGEFEVKSNGKIYLPRGGTLYSNDDVLQTEYAPNTEVAKGSDFAYEVRPRGAIALPKGVMAVTKPGGSIRLPEDK